MFGGSETQQVAYGGRQDQALDRRECVHRLERFTKMPSGRPDLCTGSIHEDAVRTFERDGTYVTRVLHTSPCDAGYGCVRRCRGWTKP